MKNAALIGLLFFCSISSFAEKMQLMDSVTLQKANGHPMQYYVSLPQGWTKEKTWPVVVIVESADNEYQRNAFRFIRARKQMPFIIVAPFNLNNSRSGRRDPAVFPYSAATWDYIDQVGDCRFNLEGIMQIMKDVQALYNAEEKYYLTGFEAGAHTVWQITFQHPEKLKAVAVVAGNYNRNSCMEDATSFSADLSKVLLPVAGFLPEKDAWFGPSGSQLTQWKEAKKAGEEHGFKKFTEIIVPQKGHLPLPDEVMEYFYALLTEEKKE